MPLSIRVPAPGAQLNVIRPESAEPGQLYLVSFKGGEQGPIVMARQHGDAIQLGPMPPDTDTNSIEKLAQLPPVQLIEVEGLLTETNPTPARIMEIMLQYAPRQNVVIHL